MRLANASLLVVLGRANSAAIDAPCVREELGSRTPDDVELAVGIAIGPAGLGWVTPDAAIQVLAALGLAYLLFLAGLEVDLAHLRGPLLRRAWLGFGASLILAVGIGYALQGAGLVGDG